MRYVRAAILALGLAAVGGCAGSPWQQCRASTGHGVGSKEWGNCLNADPRMQRANQIDQANMQAALVILGGVLQGYAEAASQGRGPDRLPIYTCPDGRFVSSGRCYRSPTGGYVGGPPRLAPDGTYVGGSGSIMLCPDGTYVAGSRCYLAPDGTYVGGFQ
jgi:hypothetical protein